MYTGLVLFIFKTVFNFFFFDLYNLHTKVYTSVHLKPKFYLFIFYLY